MDTTFGLHITLDVENCDVSKLTDNKFIYNLLNTLPSRFSMTPITLPYVVEWTDKFAKTPGLTGFVIIAESHISIHTFPEQKYSFVDIFSCRHFDAEELAKHVITALGSTEDDTTKNIITRGYNFISD